MSPTFTPSHFGFPQKKGLYLGNSPREARARTKSSQKAHRRSIRRAEETLHLPSLKWAYVSRACVCFLTQREETDHLLPLSPRPKRLQTMRREIREAASQKGCGLVDRSRLPFARILSRPLRMKHTAAPFQHLLPPCDSNKHKKTAQKKNKKTKPRQKLLGQKDEKEAGFCCS